MLIAYFKYGLILIKVRINCSFTVLITYDLYQVKLVPKKHVASVHVNVLVSYYIQCINISSPQDRYTVDLSLMRPTRGNKWGQDL